MNLSYALLAAVLVGVHVGRDLPAFHRAGRIRNEEREEVFGLADLGVEPARLVLLLQNDGHPVVDGGHELVRGRGDDRERAELVVFARVPCGPEPGEREGTAAPESYEIWGLAAAREFFPLKEARGRDEAAGFLKQRFEALLLGESLGARVYHPVPRFHVFGPCGHEPPAH